MARSHETSNKKDVKNKKDKKRKEKEKKKLQRKGAVKSSFDDMIAYVDEFGRISATPPDPNRKIEVDVQEITLGANTSDISHKADFVRKGVVTFFNSSKGFGFIRDMESNQDVFVHANNLQEIIKENNIVTFETGKGPKGLTALNVKVFKG